MTVPTALRVFASAVLLVLLPVIDAQSNSYNCGQNTFSGLSGNITSPNYPYYYENSEFCTYFIEAPSLSTFNFTFNALDLEYSSTCYWDWIEFTCESNSNSRPVRYCGYGNRPELSLGPCSRVRMTFSSDSSVVGSGFFLSYEIEPISCQGDCAPVANGAGYNCDCDANQTPYTPPPYNQCPDGCSDASTYCACSSTQAVSFSTTTPPSTTTTLTPACGQSTFSGQRGNITSPNYPFSYGNNQHCNYVIEVPSMSTINIAFDSINLEYTSTCYWDWIEFTCESNSNSRTVRYCGFGYRPVLSLKQCSRVLVSFSSDGSVTYSGFLVSYAIEPITCQGDCAPVANDAGYNCACDANQTQYIAPPYNQCPDSSCLDASTYCACSQTPTNTNTSQQTTSFEWYNPESSTMAYNNSNFVSCYECWYSGNSFDTANMSSCSPEFNSREGRVCRGVACQTYSYSYPSYAYAYVSQQCVDPYYYEESLRNCQNQSQVYGTNYFFEGDKCCSSYRDSYTEVKSCFCASDYCNNYILQPSQSNDTATSSSASNPTNGTTIPPLVTGNSGNSSGNSSQSTTRTPTNGTTPRPATLNAGNTTQSTTRAPSNGTTTPRPATLNAGNTTQSTTRLPSNGTTPRPATLNAGNTTQSTTRMPSNGTTTPRPATLNAGNTTQSTTRLPSNGTTPRPATLIAGNTTQSTTRMLSNGTTTPRPATLNAGNTTQSTTRAI